MSHLHIHLPMIQRQLFDEFAFGRPQHEEALKNDNMKLPLSAIKLNRLAVKVFTPWVALAAERVTRQLINAVRWSISFITCPSCLLQSQRKAYCRWFSMMNIRCLCTPCLRWLEQSLLAGCLKRLHWNSISKWKMSSLDDAMTNLPFLKCAPSRHHRLKQKQALKITLSQQMCTQIYIVSAKALSRRRQTNGIEFPFKSHRLVELYECNVVVVVRLRVAGMFNDSFHLRNWISNCLFVG